MAACRPGTYWCTDRSSKCGIRMCQRASPSLALRPACVSAQVHPGPQRWAVAMSFLASLDASRQEQSIAVQQGGLSPTNEAQSAGDEDVVPLGLSIAARHLLQMLLYAPAARCAHILSGRFLQSQAVELSSLRAPQCHLSCMLDSDMHTNLARVLGTRSACSWMLPPTAAMLRELLHAHSSMHGQRTQGVWEQCAPIWGWKCFSL